MSRVRIPHPAPIHMNVIEQLRFNFDHVQLLKDYETFFTSIGFELPRSPIAKHKTTVVYKNEAVPTARGTYAAEICDWMAKTFKINYAAFRLIPARSTVGFHTDLYVSRNHHIPVQTNRGCFFVSGNQLFNMQNVGYLYHVDSSRLHTFINAGDTDRVHLQFVNDVNGHLLNGEYS